MVTTTVDENNELTTYIGEVLTAKTVIKEIGRIKIAFPALSAQFIDLLIDRAIEKGFTAQRLIDSVNNVIENCQYPTPTLANFLGFDKRIKLYSYNQICDLASKGIDSFENYKVITINGTAFRVLKSDFELYNLQTEM